MEISNDLRRRFCKNANVPINMFRDPYFIDRIHLFEEQYGAITKYGGFCADVRRLGSEQNYREHYNKVKDDAIDDIKSRVAFHEFNNMEIKENRGDAKIPPISATTIFKPKHHGEWFISIDMKQANFSALHHYSPAIFGNRDSWHDFISQFTDCRSIIDSKYVRQVILGNCNPRRQVSYEKSLMTELLSRLLDFIPADEFVYFSNDEIVVHDDEIRALLPPIAETVERYSHEFGLPFRVEHFRLLNIADNIGWAKTYDDFLFQLKCIDAEYMPMILRMIYEDAVRERDLYFEFKGSLARFESVPSKIAENDVIRGLHYMYKYHRVIEI